MTNRGFISILTIVLIILGTTVTATGVYFVSQKNNKDKVEIFVDSNKNTGEKKTTEILTEEKVPLDVEVFKTSSKEDSETRIDFIPTNKGEDLADKVSAELKRLEYIDIISSDIDDFQSILSALEHNKIIFIEFSESSGTQRASSLEDLAVLSTNSDLKQLILKSANDFRGHAEVARSELNELYEPLANEVKKNIDNNKIVKDNLQTGIVVSDIENLITNNSEQLERFVSLLEQTWSAVKSVEDIKSKNYTDTIQSIKDIIAVQEVSSSLVQGLSSIEQQALNNTLPSNQTVCFAATKYSGSLVNGTSRTTVRCE